MACDRTCSAVGPNTQVIPLEFYHSIYDQKNLLKAKKSLAWPATGTYITEQGGTCPHGQAAWRLGATTA
jgi:hypothetical protein